MLLTSEMSDFASSVQSNRLYESLNHFTDTDPHVTIHCKHNCNNTSDFMGISFCINC